MSDIYQDTLPPDVSMGQLHQGVVITAPTDSASFMEVQIPAIHPDLSFQCRWQARDNMSLPADGDICLIAFDNDNVPWACAWWPISRRPTISVGETLPPNPIDGDLAIMTLVDSTGMRWWMQYDADAIAWWPIGERAFSQSIGNGPPPNPRNGDIWNATNVGGVGSGVTWRFRYNVSSSSPYKWEFVGGPPATFYPPAFTQTAGANWQAFPNIFTLPRSGDYIFAYHAWAELGANTNYNCQLVAAINGNYVTGSTIWLGTVGPANMYVTLSQPGLLVTGQPQGAAASLAAYVGGGTSTPFASMTYSVLPKRVS